MLRGTFCSFLSVTSLQRPWGLQRWASAVSLEEWPGRLTVTQGFKPNAGHSRLMPRVATLGCTRWGRSASAVGKNETCATYLLCSFKINKYDQGPLSSPHGVREGSCGRRLQQPGCCPVSKGGTKVQLRLMEMIKAIQTCSSAALLVGSVSP